MPSSSTALVLEQLDDTEHGSMLPIVLVHPSEPRSQNLIPAC